MRTTSIAWPSPRRAARLRSPGTHARADLASAAGPCCCRSGSAYAFGGWSTPVEVWLDKPPAGITGEKVVAAPKDTVVKDNCALDRQLDGTNLLVPIHVAPSVADGQYSLKLRARGMINGKAVEHTDEVLYWWERVGKVSGPVEDQKTDRHRH